MIIDTMETVRQNINKPLSLIWASNNPISSPIQALIDSGKPWYITSITGDHFSVICGNDTFRDEARSSLGSCYYFIPREKIIANTGRVQCFSCDCPTEMRRDFNDMTVREFCPRCKI